MLKNFVTYENTKSYQSKTCKIHRILKVATRDKRFLTQNARHIRLVANHRQKVSRAESSSTSMLSMFNMLKGGKNAAKNTIVRNGVIQKSKERISKISKT